MFVWFLVSAVCMRRGNVADARSSVRHPPFFGRVRTSWNAACRWKSRSPRKAVRACTCSLEPVHSAVGATCLPGQSPNSLSSLDSAAFCAWVYTGGGACSRGRKMDLRLAQPAGSFHPRCQLSGERCAARHECPSRVRLCAALMRVHACARAFSGPRLAGGHASTNRRAECFVSPPPLCGPPSDDCCGDELPLGSFTLLRVAVFTFLIRCPFYAPLSPYDRPRQTLYGDKLRERRRSELAVTSVRPTLIGRIVGKERQRLDALASILQSRSV